MKNSKQNKWWIWAPFLIIICLTWGKISYKYFNSMYYLYGRKANEKRVELKIPIIESYQNFVFFPSKSYRGERWQTKKNPTKENPLIHKWKIVYANKKDGWKGDRDALRYYIDDTTCFQLNVVHTFYPDSVKVLGSLVKVDTRKDLQNWEKEFPEYEWFGLSKEQIDSVKNVWGY
ncbi:MAG: hypothetical protein WAT92_14110 [Saprospiraceae bacterium]